MVLVANGLLPESSLSLQIKQKSWLFSQFVVADGYYPKVDGKQTKLLQQMRRAERLGRKLVLFAPFNVTLA
jgi:hypothetical protein